MRIGLVQIHVADDLSVNLESARSGIIEAAAQGAQVAVLPEMFCCPYQSRRFVQDAEPEGGPVFQQLAHMAKQAGVYLIAGSVPECEVNESTVPASVDGDAPGDRVVKRYNTAYIFSPQGALLAKHRKLHLFDVTIPGKVNFKESDTLTAGDQLTIFETPWLKIGVAICYDLRFPELFRKMALEGATLIVVPAAFNTTTGPAHWELLARARAVDNQVFVALCSPASVASDAYVSYGHSLVANSWGEVIGELGKEPAVLVLDLDLAHLETVRNQLPLLKHRRPEVYGLL